jgi:proteasome lid subunit RPN8/RPN11
VKLVPNIASNPVARFEISPQRLRALVPPVSSGLMWGLFHSHTLTDAQPSRADLFALKNYGKVHVILSTQGEIRVFLSGSSDSHQT